MSTWISNHGPFLVVLGAGVALGAGVTLLVQRLTRSMNQDLATLVSRIESLRREVESLKSDLDERTTAHLAANQSGFFSIQSATSADEEDIFEEAYEGSDYEGLQLSSRTRFEDAVPVDASELFTKVDHLLDTGGDTEKMKAFNMLQDNEHKYQKNCDFAWRLSKATYMMSQVEGLKGNLDKKKSLVYQALGCAERALQIDEENSNSHKWYAITLGSTGDYESVKVKIQNGYKFKEHIDKAIKLDSDDPLAFYLLGRWSYGVYMLSWVERRLASTLFATPPSASIDDALNQFLEANRLSSPKWKENLLYIAKCYIEKQNYNEAATWLKQADEMPTVSADEREAQEEVDKLLPVYTKYIQ